MSEAAIIVTGANRGIGFEVARGLATSGRPLIMACRNLSRSEPVRAAIARESGNPLIDLLELDLASTASIKAFAAEIGARKLRIRSLVNNAGILPDRYHRTAEGFELGLAVNYLGPALLSLLALPLMTEVGGRIINTASSAYRAGRIREDFFRRPAGNFHEIGSYADEKLALILFSLELAGRLEDRGIGVNAFDPGIVDTGIITLNRWFDPLTDLFFRPFIQGRKKGAKTAILLGRLDDPAAFQDSWFVKGRERKLPRWVREHPRRTWLWERTLEILGQTVT